MCCYCSLICAVSSNSVDSSRNQLAAPALDLGVPDAHLGGQLLNLARAESAQVRPTLAVSAAQAWYSCLSAEGQADSEGNIDPRAPHSGALGEEAGAGLSCISSCSK